jgi:hypothetical protein
MFCATSQHSEDLKLLAFTKCLLDNTDQFDEAGFNSHSVNNAKYTWSYNSTPSHVSNTQTPLPVPSYSSFTELQAVTEKQYSHYFFTNHIFSIPNNLLWFTQRLAYSNVTSLEFWMERSLEFLNASRPSCSSTSMDSIFKDALKNHTRVREVKIRFPQENSIRYIKW